MEKLKTICRWVGVDGLLHFLVCDGAGVLAALITMAIWMV